MLEPTFVRSVRTKMKENYGLTLQKDIDLPYFKISSSASGMFFPTSYGDPPNRAKKRTPLVMTEHTECRPVGIGSSNIFTCQILDIEFVALS